MNQILEFLSCGHGVEIPIGKDMYQILELLNCGNGIEVPIGIGCVPNTKVSTVITELKFQKG